jgi:uncharacterized phage protein (TIGR01671 family)
MREIKFRAWHNNAKRYMEDLCLYLDSGELGDVSECFHNLENKEDYVLEQYTGLKDKNGKEIYEGDIVKYTRSKVESIESPKGVFSSKLIELGEDFGEIAFIGFEYVVSFDHKRYDDIEKLGNCPHRFEIIGNIHEDPELLKND